MNWGLIDMASDESQTLATSGGSTPYSSARSTDGDSEFHGPTDIAAKLHELEARIEILERAREMDDLGESRNTPVSNPTATISTMPSNSPPEVDKLLIGFLIIIIWLCVGFKYLYVL
jgi:hypothetical protein